MNTYEKHYWESCLDFMHDFQNLSYLGVPFPFICPYYLLINENKELEKVLENPETQLKAKLTAEKNLQIKFDRLFSRFKGEKKYTGGKVVFYDTVLRYPNALLKADFGVENTLLLKWKTTETSVESISVDSLEKYQSIQQRSTQAYQRKATKYFQSFKQHPIFSNKSFQNHFVDQIPRMMRQILAAKNFFEKNAVSCLVLGTTNSSDTRVMSLIASLHGVPTICLQHGVIMLEFGYLPKVSSRQAVYGQWEVDWYKKRGVPEALVNAVGHPRFDEMIQKKSFNRSKLCSHFGLDKNKKCVLVVIHHLETSFTERVLSLLTKREDVNIIIKERNGKQKNSPKTLALKEKFPQLKSADGLHLYELLNNVDAVVSYESTLALEAMIAGKPVYLWPLESLKPSSTGYFKDIERNFHMDPVTLVHQVMEGLNSGWEKEREAFLKGHYIHPTSISSKKLRALVDSIKN